MASPSSTSGSSPRVGSSSSPFIIFDLDRNIRISQFPEPLPNPLEDYRPTYATLADGSLITTIYQADLFSANSRLFGVAALLTLGAVNVWTCVGYIKRGKVKDKTLFWLLLASQILLPACFAALLAPFFLVNVDCTIVNIVSVVCTEISYSILITGILGLKAYRCLSRSKLILYVVWILQIAIWVLFALDIRSIDSPRRISGSCSTTGPLRFIPIALMMTVAETLFLALCFLYAVWKSTLYRAARGRLSIAISEKPPHLEGADGRGGEGEGAPRGWWDYVPRAPTPAAPSNYGHGSTHGHSAHGHGAGRPSDDSLVKKLRNSVKRLTGSMDLSHHLSLNNPQNAGYTRKPSLPTEAPLSQGPRQLRLTRESVQSQDTTEQLNGRSNIRISTSTHGNRLSDGIRLSNAKRMSGPILINPVGAEATARTTSVKSINFASNRSSRIDPLQPMPIRPTSEDIAAGLMGTGVTTNGDEKRVPAVLQVRAVIKEEMICASLITISCIIAAGISFWRAKADDVAFGPSIWLGMNWAGMSLLIMRTFSQVVRRHEREALLQSPSPFGVPFGPNAATTAMARRRRDAFALATQSSSVISPFSPLDAPGSNSTRRRAGRRSSWDYASSLRRGEAYTPSVFEDNASLRRREGLKQWDEEKERRRLESRSDQGHGSDLGHPLRRASDPFADMKRIDGFDYGNEFDPEDGDISRRKSSEGPIGLEEMMLETDPIHGQRPLVADPWNENPFADVRNPFITAVNPFASTDSSDSNTALLSRKRSLSPFATMDADPILPTSNTGSPRGSGEAKTRFLSPFGASINRAGPVTPKPPSAPPSYALPPPPPTRGARRGAITDVGVFPNLVPTPALSRNNSVQVHVQVSTQTAVSSHPPSMKEKEGSARIGKLTPPPLQPPPSPPQSHNGSSIELLESSKFGN